MSSLVLSVNAGSSSLKVSLFAPTFDGTSHLATCSVSSIGSEGTEFKSTSQDVSDGERNMQNVRDHDSALGHVLGHLFRTTTSQEDITHVCHRVVHGGDYAEHILIDQEALHHLEALIELAPLHNAASTALIRSCLKQLPNTKSIAWFDTTFHRSIPPSIYTYPMDPELTKKYGLRKYGFHGISYSFILRSVSDFLKKPTFTTNLIVLHLGAGASACCIKDGKSLDTSMSLTPLAGLPGATRSGSIDPTAILHLMNESKDSSVEHAENILNKQSGWKSLTGTSSFGDIVDSEEPNKKLAFDIFVDRIIGFVGAYFVKLGGQVDALVFAGGIGEKSPQLRAAVANKCFCLGFNLNDVKNRSKDEEETSKTVRSIGGGPKQILVCQTDEQYEMAYQLMRDDKLYQK
ncbi:acetate kinase [Serendipita vermifera]|nr:acetate kinase [Serendipita vermifera]